MSLHWSFARFIQSLILLVFSVFLYKLHSTGDVYRLVSTTIASLVKAVSYIFYVLTIYRFLTAFLTIHHNHERHCGCDHEHIQRLRLSWFLLLAPAFFGVMVPVYTMDTTSLSNHAFAASLRHSTDIKTSPQLSDIPLRNMNPSTKSVELSFLNFQDNYYANPGTYEKSDYTVTGIIYHPPSWPQTRFIVMRYVITCCVADAEAMGIVAETNRRNNFADNTWVQIKGNILPKTVPTSELLVPLQWTYPNKKVPVMNIKRISQIKEPRNPYLSATVIKLN